MGLLNLIGNKVGVGSGGGGTPDLDNTETYQNLFLDESITDLYNTTYRPTDSSVDVWLNLDDVTSANIPNSDDALASIPNSGTGADAAQSTLGARPYYKTSFSKYLEPVVSGTRVLTDSWWRYPIKSFRVESDRFMNLTPVVQNPTYLEGFVVVNLGPSNANKVIFAHRSETTRLIQVTLDANSKYILQLRSSGNVLKTITSTVTASRGELDIVYFRFDKAGNNHAISVNGETEVTDTTNFGSETFNSTIQSLGALTTNAGSSYSAGCFGNYHEIIIKYSAFTSQHKADCLTYLRGKYLEFRQSTTPSYTHKATSRLISLGEDVKSIIENISSDTHIVLATGEHIVDSDHIQISASNINIEVPTGASIKLADGAAPTYYVDLVTNQHDNNPMTGINVSGTYSGSTKKHIWIVTDGTGTPNTFKWIVGPSDGFPPTGGGTGFTGTGANIPMSTSPTLITDGISVSFDSTTGHALNSGCIIAIGGKFGIFDVGTGFQTDYIENVKIFGDGLLDANGANQAEGSVHSINSTHVVKFHGRVRNCGVYGVSLINAHRVFLVYGDHDGTYLSGGGVSGGTSYDQEFTDLWACDIDNLGDGDAAIELGHPMHRGQLLYVRCVENDAYAYQVPIELNFKMKNYLCRGNLVRTTLTNSPIFCWRRSDDGVVKGNRQYGSTSTPVVTVSAPAGWETAVNILQNDNITI